MDIVFINKKLEQEFNTQRLLIKKHGSDRARRIARRLSQLRAANHLAELRHAPGRCHELTGNRAGQISLDLDHPYRLLFSSASNPPPTKPDGGLDWSQITSITILGVEDTHE